MADVVRNPQTGVALNGNGANAQDAVDLWQSDWRDEHGNPVNQRSYNKDYSLDYGT